MREMHILVSMRLIDMARYHPSQDNSRVCGFCGAQLGIYPSAQRALKKHPHTELACVPCALERAHPDDDNRLAGTWEEAMQEFRDSRPVGKA